MYTNSEVFVQTKNVCYSVGCTKNFQPAIPPVMINGDYKQTVTIVGNSTWFNNSSKHHSDLRLDTDLIDTGII